MSTNKFISYNMINLCVKIKICKSNILVFIDYYLYKKLEMCFQIKLNWTDNCFFLVVHNIFFLINYLTKNIRLLSGFVSMDSKMFMNIFYIALKCIDGPFTCNKFFSNNYLIAYDSVIIVLLL